MGHILSHDEYLGEAVFFLEIRKIGDDFADEIHGFPMDPEAVFEFVVIGFHGFVIFGGEHP